MSLVKSSFGLLIFALAFSAGIFMGNIYGQANAERPPLLLSHADDKLIPFPENEEALREMAAEMMKGRSWTGETQDLQDIAPASGE